MWTGPYSAGLCTTNMDVNAYASPLDRTALRARALRAATPNARARRMPRPHMPAYGDFGRTPVLYSAVPKKKRKEEKRRRGGKGDRTAVRARTARCKIQDPRPAYAAAAHSRPAGRTLAARRYHTPPHVHAAGMDVNCYALPHSTLSPDQGATSVICTWHMEATGL